MPSKGAILSSQSQHLVLNVLVYFEEEQQHGGPIISINSVQERVAAALKISVRTLLRIKCRNNTTPILGSPGKKRSCKKFKTTDLPECIKMNIRDTVYTMYANKKHLTVQSLNVELREKEIVLSNTSLKLVLHQLGFKFQKEGNRRALTEPSLENARIKFMRLYKNTMDSVAKRQVIFMDETWIFSKGNATRSWQDDDVRSVREPGGYDGERFVVVHAGSEAGFVHGASLLFAFKSQNADYHGEMNGDTFLQWLEERLVNNLEEPSLIVLDNAPYHSMLLEKVPTSSWKNADIIQWLITNNIEYNSQMFKTKLLALVKVHRKEKSYKVDEFLRSCGHDVLRLPPYHCQCN